MCVHAYALTKMLIVNHNKFAISMREATLLYMQNISITAACNLLFISHYTCIIAYKFHSIYICAFPSKNMHVFAFVVKVYN